MIYFYLNFFPPIHHRKEIKILYSVVKKRTYLVFEAWLHELLLQQIEPLKEEKKKNTCQNGQNLSNLVCWEIFKLELQMRHST